MKVSGNVILNNGNVKKLLGVLHTATDHAGELTELLTPIAGGKGARCSICPRLLGLEV